MHFVLARDGVSYHILPMADKTSKFEENAKGAFYVDNTCIACDACSVAAPNNFKLLEDEYAYVFKQPDSDEEKEQCIEAMESCPVEAIGDDGD